MRNDPIEIALAIVGVLIAIGVLGMVFISVIPYLLVALVIGLGALAIGVVVMLIVGLASLAIDAGIFIVDYIESWFS